LAPQRPKRVTGKQLLRILETFGWRVERTKGSHHIMRHPDHPRVTLSVPVHGRQTLPIGTLMDILKDANISVEEFARKA
jgi:predicted RNA binding protein YcfA (HicA-like mRNA interferase family)